jgi:hypothetical protein
MPKFPEPPGTLTAPAASLMLRSATRLWRLYFAGGPHPSAWNGFRFYGPTAARFDHHHDPPHMQERGVLYAAANPTTCLAESFQATRVIDRYAHQPWLVGFDLVAGLRLLDLAGTWPTRVGASMAINTGPRARARRWSRGIYAAYPYVAGLRYPSSIHANRDSVALYERALAALPPAPVFHRALADLALLPRLASAAATLGYRLV